jgi:hypothetical protein
VIPVTLASAWPAISRTLPSKPREAQVGRQLQIESELYARKYEGISLELQHNRALEDINIQYERLGQNVARDQEKFANQQADMTQDKNLDYAEFNRKIMRQRRDQGYTEEDFANAQRFSNPVGAVGKRPKMPSSPGL